MISISHREKEGEKIYKKFDKQLEKKIEKINSITDIKTLRNYCISLSKELRGFQHMYYELFFKIAKSKRPEFSNKIQLQNHIYNCAHDNLEFAKANNIKFTRSEALNNEIDIRLNQNKLVRNREPITPIEKKFRKIELDRTNFESSLLNMWKESLSDSANKSEAQSFLQGFANHLTHQKYNS